MADNVPVSDVLCEAMEYLSKLGSNLRTRTEALKERRVRRDKLKNSHAVKKAANKVLLICDLSKKSLENVESGVRNILRLVDASQADLKPKSGGKSTDSHYKSIKYHYFEYNSRKLKIRQKIFVKHYTSVQVYVKKMPLTMMDKYPVYLDCELYRMRQKCGQRSHKEAKIDSKESMREQCDDINSKSIKRCLSPKSGSSDSESLKNHSKSKHKKKKSRSQSPVSKKSANNETENVEKRRTEDSGKMSYEKSRDSNTVLTEPTANTDTPKNIDKKKDSRRIYTSSDSEESDSTYSKRKVSRKLKKRKDSYKDERKKTNCSDSSDSGKEKSNDRGKRRHSLSSDSDMEKLKKNEREKCFQRLSYDSDNCNRKDGKKVLKQRDSLEQSSKSKSPDKEKLKVGKRSISSDSDIDERKKIDSSDSSSKQKSNDREKHHQCLSSDSDNSEKSDRTKVVKQKDSLDKSSKSKSTDKEKPKVGKMSTSQDSNKDVRKKTNCSDSSDSGKEKSNDRGKRRHSLSSDSGDSDRKAVKLRDSLDKSSKSKHPDKKKSKVDKRRNSKRISSDSENSGKDESKDKERRSKSFINISDSEDSDNNVFNKLDKTKDSGLKSGDVVSEQDCKKSRKISSDSDESRKENTNKEEDKQEKDVEDKLSNVQEDPKTDKPLIKCVNLNKLLKPDILESRQMTDPIVKEVDETKCSSILSRNSSPMPSKKKKKVRYEDEELFWADKRKEVRAFKAKEFSVNVVRLPKINEDLLIRSSNLASDSVQPLTLPDLCKAKTSLLIESDSDNSNVGALNNDTERVKKTLLEDSESDDASQEQPAKKVKLLDTSKPNEGHEMVKNTLLADSESENETQDREEVNLCAQSTTELKTVKEKNYKEKQDVQKHPAKKIKLIDKSKPNTLLDNSPQNESEEHEMAENTLLANSESENETQEREEGNENAESTKEPISVNDNSLSKDNDTEEQEVPEIQNSATIDNISGLSLVFPLSNSNTKELDSEKLDEASVANQPEREKKSNEASKSKSKESIDAKKMLLTSGSESEDERFNEVLKGIKQKLLQDIDSEDENSVNKSSKPNNSSSEESDSDVGKVKKKRHDRPPTKRKETSTSRKKMGRSRGKPGGSSNNSSDTQDDKHVDGLANLKSLTRTRRRRGSGDPPSSSKASKSSSKQKMPKVQASFATQEGLVEVASSSEEASAVESDAVDEDLPQVKLPGLNGAGIEHLSKDDLLRESDSSSSNEKDKNSEDDKKDESEREEENVKSKRRKANTISSDSEAGSSKPKQKGPDGRISDFEDSEEESSEPTKKAKRKKKADDSDASGDGSSSDGGKKKRRRIKQIRDSDASGSDSENEGRNKHGRKNIRKVMGKNQLEEATKKAARQEKERMARIAERQKMYNNMQFDESGKPDEVVLDKVVLDFDPETKEPLIEVDRGLVKKLKPHQANGIKFMWDACFESVKRIKKDRGSGCILAHCMGLGKTLQVVTLTHTLLTHSDLTGVRRALVVCPLSTVLNWVNEFRMWLRHAQGADVDVYELSRFKQNSERAFQLSQWFQHGGVCVLGYEMFRNLSADNNKKFKKKMLKNFQESLVDPGPDLVVCDEGHLLKNEKTSLSQSMNKVSTQRRIVLTGTPLQNNLKEYYCMVQFVKPNLLGKYNEYLNRFVNPITNGQYTDSTEHDIRIMKRRSHVLHKMLDGAVQRRDYGVLAPFLPPKHEYVLFITLTPVQTKLYQHYLDNYSRRPLPGKSSGFLFPDFQSLQRIWTHPLVLKYNSERYEIMQQKKRDREEEEDSEGSLADFIDDDSTPDESSTDESSGSLSDVSDDSRKKSKKKKAGKKGKDKKAPRRGTRANPVELDPNEPVEDITEVKNENPTEWWVPLVSEPELEDVRHSHKLLLLLDILRQCEAIGDKLLVFSQSLYSLDLIEHFLGRVDEATQEGRVDERLAGHLGSWSPGVDYFRLDGSSSCENRSIWCKNFNREDNPRARLFLISTRAGGLGINLVAANRVVIFDVSWNPSHDVQSIFRVYRFGQKKPCYVYRFLVMGTMEEKIYERQVTKQAISKRVIDEQQIDRHYAENDLAELYKFEPAPPTPRPVPPVPRDRLFAELLKDHAEAIYKFHEHDSLLENKEEETLSEEERKAAWEDFENEKNRPPPAPFPSSWPMHNNGMVLAQQQQQLAYVALAAMLRKDMPNLSDDNIRNMLPLIYGANPSMFGGYDYGLMQKLNDMYKYPQAAMMNPAMMNQAMNPGAAAGGTSTLQYEPPWQREQQQQQQMRLQQMLQHQQNSMGAKYYAGGLGSRDPVAMALQQQRAREMLLEPSQRPRGRPPHRPPAPHNSTDVVNLDSD